MEGEQPVIPTLVVGPEPQSIGAVRRFVASTVDPSSPRLGDVEVMTSELVANAVAHASTPVTVRVVAHDGRTRVEVHDDDPNPPLPQAPSLDLRTGRGLAIVEALSDDWGYSPVEGDGKVVWFEIGLDVNW